ncbi:hypothetical protein QBC40DRAFT_162467 [Triangularia verruculosa]|uniref:Uncharacterized protein n=1 Tax=Triangularia verruculosa TaxID=2587418 RepID=A0AAN6XRN2_9PEZI|nr:hypothetical protein QBC40DRAFT_162467 [Triangularia verruculosa]
MVVIRIRKGSNYGAGTVDYDGSNNCRVGSRRSPCHRPLRQRGDQRALLPHAIQRRYQNYTSTAPLTVATPIQPVDATPTTRETNALFNTDGVTIAVGLDAVFGLALVIFLSGVVYQWKRGKRLRAEQEERDRVADGVEVNPAVSVSKESSQLSSEVSGARVKVGEAQVGDEKGGSSKEQVRQEIVKET